MLSKEAKFYRKIVRKTIPNYIRSFETVSTRDEYTKCPKEFKMVIYENCKVTSFTRFEDPGDYPSNAGSSPLPSGPLVPEEVDGYAIFVFDPDEEKELFELIATSKDISSEDFVHDLILGEFDFGHDVRCTRADIKTIRIGESNYFLAIPLEAKAEDSEVSIVNEEEDDIIAKATEVLRRKYNAQN